MSDVNITIVIGDSRTISTSKIRKVTAIRKNRSENGIHADRLQWQAPAGSVVSCCTYFFDPEDGGDIFLRNVG
jgi:hypothetical protein